MYDTYCNRLHTLQQSTKLLMPQVVKLSPDGYISLSTALLQLVPNSNNISDGTTATEFVFKHYYFCTTTGHCNLQLYPLFDDTYSS